MTRRIENYLFSGLLICAFSAVAYAQAGVGHFTVSQPMGNGSLDLDVSIPGIVPFGGNESGTRVRVTGIKRTDTAAEKAVKVRNAINSAFGEPPPVATINPATPNTVDLQAPAGTPKAGQAGVAKVSHNGDGTHERALVAQVDVPSASMGTLAGYIDYDTALSGVDANGLTSIFTASFGFDGLTDTASLSFDQLSDPSLSGLAADMFNQLLLGLPVAFESNLSLDLLTGEIVFYFPAGQTNYFVQNFSTDTEVGLSGGFAYVPEPGTLLLLGAGLLVLGGAGTVRRKFFS